MGYLPDEDFFSIYSKVPRLTIDLLLYKEGTVLLSLRSIEPYLGFWHLPGGTVYKDETVEEAAIRIAKKETGLVVAPRDSVGHMEFPNEMRPNGKGESINIHTISIVVPADVIGGTLQADKDAAEVRWFEALPDKTIAQHKIFLTKFLQGNR